MKIENYGHYRLTFTPARSSMILAATLRGTSAYSKNSMVYDARPWVSERSSVA